MDQEQDVVGAAEVVAELAFRAAELTQVDEGLYIGMNRVLTRPEDVIRDAFDGIVHQVRVEAGREVWLGKVG